MPKNPATPTAWYDFPHYYDVSMRSETSKEVAFIEAACRKYCPFAARRLLEPACGTGRILTALAARGYRMTGVDLNEPSLEYLRRRLARRNLKAHILRADMAEFRLPGSVDAAYCLLNSFRHLGDEASARRHLECVAASLRPGGIYLLGIHLLPPDAAEECVERWTESYRNTRVTVTFRVLEMDRRRRVEHIRVSVLARESGRTIRLRQEFPLRIYTAAQFRKLLASVPSLELCDVYDFWYELDQPLQLSNELSDVVFVLRRRVTA